METIVEAQLPFTVIFCSSRRYLLSVLLFICLLLNGADFERQFVNLPLCSAQQWKVGVIGVGVLKKALNGKKIKAESRKQLT